MESKTVLKYITESGAATGMEIMQYSKADPKGYARLREMAAEEMAFIGQPITATK